MKKLFYNTLASMALCASAHAGTASPAQLVPMTQAQANVVAARVKLATQQSWQAYKKYAWGHDALKPLSKQPHDWYAKSLLMTPIDALDTLLIMGLKKEANEATELIAKLSFDQDMYVQNFEITIRLLGGLLSAYQITNDARLLAMAEDLGTRLLPVFESPTGLPYTHVNLRTGQVRGNISNPAETGTLLLEFGTLARLTNKPVFYDKAKRALVATYQRSSAVGLVGSAINVETGEWTDSNAHIGGGIDSYYEYLYKCWRLFGDIECKSMWESSISAVNRHLADEVRGELWYGHADMRSGARTKSQYGALDAFMPALLVLGGDLDRARRLQDSGMKMWRLHGIEPEALNYQTMQVSSPEYALRPEIVESAYYLFRHTGEAKYRAMGQEMLADFLRHCRANGAFAALADVRSKKQSDSMESFVFAETFKYFYLLFAAPETLNFEAVTFNTEAHPLRPVPAH